jgi:hypothetical protein
VLSLVFVPAMFMLMDDVGALIWRFGKRLIVSHQEDEEPPLALHGHGHPPAKGPSPVPPKVAPAAE